MAQELPLEVRTARFRRIENEKIQVFRDKFGTETIISWPVKLVYETEKAEPRHWDHLRGEYVMYPEGHRRTAEVHFSHGFDGGYLPWERSAFPEEVERLRTEYEAVLASMGPELQKIRERAEKSRQKRLTGDGAKARIDGALERLERALVRAPDDLDTASLRKILRIHGRKSLVGRPYEGSFHVYLVEGTLAEMETEGLTSDSLLRTLHQLQGCPGMSEVLQHAASNPMHWDMLTDQHFREALARAVVREITNS